MSDPKSFVHILKSITHPFESYTAVTSNPQARLISHNAGLSSHTAEHRPWRTLVVIQFDEEEPRVRALLEDRIGPGRSRDVTSGKRVDEFPSGWRQERTAIQGTTRTVSGNARVSELLLAPTRATRLAPQQRPQRVPYGRADELRSAAFPTGRMTHRSG